MGLTLFSDYGMAIYIYIVRQIAHSGTNVLKMRVVAVVKLCNDILGSGQFAVPEPPVFMFQTVKQWANCRTGSGQIAHSTL